MDGGPVERVDVGPLAANESSPDSDPGEYGHLELNDETETALRDAESFFSDTQGRHVFPSVAHQMTRHVQPDIEDLVMRASPYELFRGQGSLSVSDLVGPVWCEMQFDYRLRSLPHLPPDQRPDHIESARGKVISMDKSKVQTKERILRRGEVIHKRLEQEIYPTEVKVNTSTREDVWALRFLNMFSALEALITVGTCRELPVVGFVGDVLVRGVIDEIKRVPADAAKPNTRSSRQPSLYAFFGHETSSHNYDQMQRTHCIMLSDSKTRVSGTVPRAEDTLAGRLQLMLYKELLDGLLFSPSRVSSSEAGNAILPSSRGFDWARLWTRLDLDPDAIFSETFVRDSRPIISGNGLRWGTSDAKNLNDQVKIWAHYVRELGLGWGSDTVPRSKVEVASPGPPPGTSDLFLELVYRRASAKQGPRGHKRRKTSSMEVSTTFASEEMEDTGFQSDAPATANHALCETPSETVGHLLDGQLEATAIELCDDLEILRSMEDNLESSSPVLLQPSGSTRALLSERQQTIESRSSASGGVIGRSRFKHDPRMLETHLRSVLDVWMGRREPVGVSLNHINRCAWCEFEDGCEWRIRKAEEAIARARRRAAIRASLVAHIA